MDLKAQRTVDISPSYLVKFTSTWMRKQQQQYPKTSKHHKKWKHSNIQCLYLFLTVHTLTEFSFCGMGLWPSRLLALFWHPSPPLPTTPNPTPPLPHPSWAHLLFCITNSKNSPTSRRELDSLLSSLITLFKIICIVSHSWCTQCTLQKKHPKNHKNNLQ